jgi:ABC-2 type transport system permease protein
MNNSKIKLHRIGAFLLRHWYEILATIDRKVDIIFWPTIDLLAFGLLAVYIDKFNLQIGVTQAMLGGLILWTLVYSIQRDVTIALLDEAWSRNLYNLLSSPISIVEIILGTFILSFIKAFITIALLLFLASSLFSFNLLAFGWQIIFFILNIFIFGWAFGYFTSFLVFRFGTKVQTVAWSLIAILYPISGVLYPLETLPIYLANIAKLFPVSYIFEAVRGIILRGEVPGLETLLIIFALNIFYLLIGVVLYIRGFNHAKMRGWFIHPS